MYKTTVYTRANDLMQKMQFVTRFSSKHWKYIKWTLDVWRNV